MEGSATTVPRYRCESVALGKIGQSREWSVEILSLNDPSGGHELSYSDIEVGFAGCMRAKSRFVLSGLWKAFGARGAGTSIIVAAHPNLGVPASWMRWIHPGLQTITMAHGIDVWKPLPTRRLRALQEARLVIVPSRNTAQKVAEVQGIPESRIRRLPLPLNPNFLRLARTAKDLRLPANFPKGHIILTVGRWASSERYKGADELIFAVAHILDTIPDLHLVMVGTGDDLPRLRGIVVERKIGEHVHFFEYLPQEEVAACYANAHVFALPSTGEGYGLVFLEAMAFAKPVVGVAAGGATDLVRDGINGLLIPPNDVQRLAQSLTCLLQDEPLRKRLGDSGAAIVRREYTFDAFCDSLERILSEVESVPS